MPRCCHRWDCARPASGGVGFGAGESVLPGRSEIIAASHAGTDPETAAVRIYESSAEGEVGI